VPPPADRTAAPVPAPGPLSPEHLAALSAAKTAAKRIRRTAGVARASAWTTGSLAGLTLLGVLLGDFTSLVLGAVILVIAVREGRFGARLGAFDVYAARKLAVNQLILGGVIVVYAGWRAFTGWYAKPESSGNPQVDAMLADYGPLVKSLTVGFYLCVALGGALGTGLMALYYSRRASMVRAFLANQPRWVVDALRAAG
jgi:hypothetical protein